MSVEEELKENAENAKEPFDRKVALGLENAALKFAVPMTDPSQFLTLIERMRIRRHSKILR